MSHDPGKEARAATGIPVVPAFDGFRAYAIFGVVAVHILGFSGVLIALGDGTRFQLVQGTLGQAIDVLFVISGFVVFLPTVARGGEFGGVRAFAIRRAARLVPAYWAILVLSLVLLALFPLTPALPTPDALSVIANTFFLQTPVQMFHEVPAGFGVTEPVWTLSLEITFYLLLPLVAGWYFRHPLLGLAIAGLFTALWHEAFIHYDDFTSVLGLDPSAETSTRIVYSSLSQFPYFAFSFAAGMTGAWAYVRCQRDGSEAVARWVPRVQAASLVVLAVCVYLVGHKSVNAPFAAEIGRRPWLLALAYSGSLATLMVAIALGPKPIQWPFANRLVRWLGDISYGVYLVHMVVITFALRGLDLAADTEAGGLVGESPLVAGDGKLDTMFLGGAIVVSVSILYGYLSARFLEQPIRRWARRYGRRGAPAGR